MEIVNMVKSDYRIVREMLDRANISYIGGELSIVTTTGVYFIFGTDSSLHAVLHTEF